ncbi:MAG: HAD-IA family hydrolase [Nitrospinae bacterium]|nr:HAD-IA family hydrolase [Nitrospinota bacterium]
MTIVDVDTIVFDLDGTLIDSKEDIADALNHTFGEMGYDPLPMSVIESFVGNGINPLIHKAVIAADHLERETEALNLFRERYWERLLVKTRPYDGVADTLKKLGGRYHMGLISNKPQRFTFKIVDELGWGPYFDGAVYGGDTLPVKKPDPAALLAIAEKYGTAPERLMIVGDSAVDVATGRNAGARTVGVTYGFRGVDELKDAGVEILIDRFGELLDILGGAK